jgi:hypothetical protein
MLEPMEVRTTRGNSRVGRMMYDVDASGTCSSGDRWWNHGRLSKEKPPAASSRGLLPETAIADILAYATYSFRLHYKARLCSAPQITSLKDRQA